ncbi:glycosyltransferase [Shewanella seohaensis]|uniref:glycosyltransferase n=1 Tax=Shewanella seohaensis TaxID=755175 RepID=UPI00200CD601|nr:glycosyltransferase [Shewanella seohaensis]MCL1120031.1 glycosyltransferase [Shewanella seohaensis]UXM81352.1 glycosyltransferase [Shewanella seohaensis]
MDTLVTIAVIAYNSEKTILDTLDSILRQKYNKKCIEVVISDDASADATLSVAETWAKENVLSFYGIKCISGNTNKGVSANCDSAWRNASGDWIKTIAADDILLDDCIVENVDYICKNELTHVLFSNMIPFTEQGRETPICHDKSKFLGGPNEQLKILLKECYLLAPTSFVKRDVLIQVGYADLRYPMLDDYPLWFRCLTNGYRMDYMDKATVLYRKGDSLSQQAIKIGNLKYLQSLYSFQRDELWPLLSFFKIFKKWDDSVVFYEKLLWIKYIGNKNTILYRFFHFSLFLIRPYKVQQKIIDLFR